MENDILNYLKLLSKMKILLRIMPDYPYYPDYLSTLLEKYLRTQRVNI